MKAKLVKEHLNEGTYSDFLMDYGQEIKQARKQIQIASKIIGNIGEDDKLTENFYIEFEKAMQKYDVNVGDMVDTWLAYAFDGDLVEADEIVKFAMNNQDRYGTEMKFILQAIEDMYNIALQYK
jgi:hypothetical protein